MHGQPDDQVYLPTSEDKDWGAGVVDFDLLLKEDLFQLEPEALVQALSRVQEFLPEWSLVPYVCTTSRRGGPPRRENLCQNYSNGQRCWYRRWSPAMSTTTRLAAWRSWLVTWRSGYRRSSHERS